MEQRHILTPDQRLRVFVSSTLQELEEARAATSRLLELRPMASVQHYRTILPFRDSLRLRELERLMRLAEFPE